jgi:FkbM family methyltransferase
VSKLSRNITIVACFMVLAGCFLLSRPVLGGNYLTIAAFKDSLKARSLPTFSKLGMFYSFLKVDLQERIFGRAAVQKCQVGSHLFAVQDAAIAKNLLIDIFIRQDYFFPYFASAPRIIDCGANVGFSLAYFKFCYPDAKIIAFEPDPKNYSLLKNNVALAGFDSVELRQQAVAGSEGKILFEGNATTGGLVSGAAKAGDFFVDAVKLSDSILEPIDILKMDIEGAESLVLRDLDRTGKIRQIKNIIMEFHYTAVAPNALGEVLSMFERRGFKYQIKSVSGMTQAFDSAESVRQTLNCLMIYAYQ